MPNWIRYSTMLKASTVAVAAGLLLTSTEAERILGHAAGGVAITLESLPFDGVAFMAFFPALFAIMNPLVAIPMFVSMTEGESESKRRRLALIASATVLLTLAAAALFGREILAAFAIGVPSFRIAGGIIVLLMGLSLLSANAVSKLKGATRDGQTPRRDSDAVCPLAIPLVAGPGAIATVILRCESAAQTTDLVTVGATILAMTLVSYAILRVAVPIARMLGESGLTVLTRLLGMVVSAIAIDMMAIGVRAAFPGVAG